MNSLNITIFCPECRGRFRVERDEIVEGEIIDCPLCTAEIITLQENPIKIALYNEDNIF